MSQVLRTVEEPVAQQDVLIEERVRDISELGWTTEKAAAMRHKFAAFADDWNDPAMDAYDEEEDT